MSFTEEQTIPVFARWFGSWQIRVERRPLAPPALAAAYDCAAPRWTRLTDRLGYSRAYARLFEAFFASRRIDVADRPLRVLDCGVGTGGFALALARVWGRPIEVTGVDISPQMINIARRRFRRAGIAAHLKQASICALPFADASFDVVIAAHVLEHLPDPVTALMEMRRVLRPGGWLIACMTCRSWLGAYIQAKWRTHRLTPSVAANWLRAAGFRPQALKVSPPGLFRLTSLASIGHNSKVGASDKENTL